MHIKTIIISFLLLFVAQPVFATTLFPSGGGTGSTTLTGILIGNGISPVNSLTIGANLLLTGTVLSSTASGGGSGSVSTSSVPVIGGLAYWTTTTATPALLSTVATSTLSASSPLTGSWVVVGSGGSAGIQPATASQGGYETQNEFNYVHTATSTFTAPLTYTGSTNAVTCASATGSVAGCLSSTDWNTFNGKDGFGWPWTPTTQFGQRGDATSTILALTGSPFSLVASSTVNFVNASTTNFTVFTGGNVWLAQLTGPAALAIDSTGKVYAAATTTAGNPSGSVGASSATNGTATTYMRSDAAPACTTATASVPGCLAAADFTTFNGKLNFSNLFNKFTTYATSTLGTTTPTYFPTAFYSSSTASVPATMDNLNVIGNATTTNATTTTFAITNAASALLLTNSSGSVGKYGGAAACTNQFVTALSAVGASSCASVTDSTFSGQLGTAHGGTGKDFSASTGVIVDYAGTMAATASSTLYNSGTAGQVLMWSGTTGTPVWAATTSPMNFFALIEENPSGTINGSNTAFTVNNSPTFVSLNGSYQIAGGVDYTLTGTGPYTITFVTAPSTGSNLRSLYTAVSSGIPVTVANGGTGVTSQTTNGVNYYNGSIITSGTGLTFDGTHFGVATTSFTTDSGAANRPLLSIDATSSLSEEGLQILGNVNDFFEDSLKNSNNGALAQGCRSLGSPAGTQTTNFLSLCVNSGIFWNPQSYTVGGPNDTSLMSAMTGGDLFIDQATANQKIHILNGGTSTSTNEAMTFSGVKVGVGSTTPWATFSVVGNLNQPIFVVATSSTGLASSTEPLFMIDQNEHFVSGGGQPTVSACGTTPGINGNDHDMLVTTGSTGVTNCTVTFAKAYSANQTIICSFDEQNSAGIANATIVGSTTATTLKIGLSASLTSVKIGVICDAFQ